MSTQVGVLVSVVFFVAGIALGDSLSVPRLSPDELVGEALDCEIHARDVQRNALLESALKQDPKHQQARWHAGFVQYRGQWIPFDTLTNTMRTDPAYEKYLRIRKQFPDTPADHLDLAKWCEKIGFPELSQAHQFVANNRDSNNVADDFTSLSPLQGTPLPPLQGTLWSGRIRSDLFESEDEDLDPKQARKWKTKLTFIIRGLNHPSKKIREESLKRFKKIDPREVTVVIESVVDQVPSILAKTLVTSLGSLSDKEVDQALVRMAIDSESSVVRTAAVEQLQSRPEKTLIPLLLAELETTFDEPRFQYGPPSRWGQSYRWSVLQEKFDIFEEVIFEISGPSRNSVTLVRDPTTAFVTGVISRGFQLFERAVTDMMARLKVQNQQIQRRNQRICWALKRLTDERLSSDQPEPWWSWWDEKTNSMSTEKPVVQTYRYRTVAKSCFAAGTPVVTFDGLRPIEKIQAGDLVLSQDIATGQLAFRPVLRTTLRTPTQLITVSADEENFHCTGNHAFWVPGDGWVHARRLKSGGAVHRVRGTSLIGSVDYGKVEEAYNLVIPDFHTYFVGKQGILVHDITPAPATKSKVPGGRRR